jgi:hypothetical protein
MEDMDGRNQNYHGYKQYVKQWTHEFEGGDSNDCMLLSMRM